MIYLIIGIIFVILIFKNWIFLCGLLFIFIFLFVRKKYFKFLLIVIGCLFGFISNINFFTYQDDTSFQGIIYESKENYFLINSKGKNYYVYQKNNEYEQFDIVKIEGKSQDIYFSVIEGDFDFNKYLYEKNVDKEIKYTSISFVYRHIFRKKALINKFLMNFNDESKDYISLFLFGINSEFTNKLYKLQLANYFSFSGLIIFSIHTFFKKILKNKGEIVSKIFLFPFLIFSSYRLSFLKNYLMLFNNKSNLFILFLILCLNKRFLFSSSFIYLFFIPFIFKLVSNKIEKNKLAKKMFFLLLINIGFIYYDGKFNVINLIIFPLMMIFSKILFILILLFLLIRTPFLINLFCKFLNYLFSLFSKFPVLYFEEKNILLIITLIISLFLFIVFQEIKLKKISLTFIGLYFFILGLTYFPINNDYLIFINVGQGDCVLIHHHKINILIDTGGILNKDIANDNLIPFFYKHHIKKLDNVFISHNDYDHSGALEQLKTNFIIENVIYGSTFDEIKYDNLIFKNLNIYQRGYEENDNSSVIYFSFLNKNFLFMGDASSKIEKNILNDYQALDVDILKLGHHGSKTSSSYEFLKFINPSEAIISVGRNNYYHHPDKIVLTYLNDLKIKVRRTDIEGSIKYQ